MAEIIGIAINLAQAVQLVVAALKGEAALVMSARQLVHSCRLYEDCLSTLRIGLRNKAKAQQALRGKLPTPAESASGAELKKSMVLVFAQIEQDCALLKAIKEQTQAVAESSVKYNVVVNAVISNATGRIQKIKSLEAELLSRVQIVTSLMVKDSWNASHGLDPQLLDDVADVDGALFWHGHFKRDRAVSFRRFMEAYQAYISSVFLFKRIPDAMIMTLLRHTLSTGAELDDALLLGSEVTVAAFGTWLRRYGPLKETLCKAAAFSLPTTGESAPWFGKAMGRDAAQRKLSDVFSKFQATGIRPHQAVIVRYSSDPSVHFVVTTKPGSSIEHFPIVNGPTGYAVKGEEEHFSPTIVDCLQYHIFDKLLSRTAQAPLALPRTSIEQWDEVFAGSTAELPQNHYLSVQELNRAIAEAQGGAGPAVSSCDQSASFASLFDVSAPDEGEEEGGRTGSVTAEARKHAPAELSEGVIASGAPTAAIGRYMVEHGLALLLQTGEIDSGAAEIIRSMVSVSARPPK